MSESPDTSGAGKNGPENFQSLEFSAAPLVSIIIPYHNCRKLTEECLRSVAEHSDGVDYEIILIDDASTDQPDIESLTNRDRIRIFRNMERRSFSQNNNGGADVSRGEFMVLLNNDTLVTPGWLDALVAAARQEENLGVLGNKHLYPQSGLLQHAGMAFDDKGFPYHLTPGTNPNAPAVNVRREFQCVTFACVLIPKAVYWQLCGLDEDYRNGFEDVDFCLRARAEGYRVVYNPDSVIFHYGQQTPGRTDTDNANWKTFRSRWGGKVELDLRKITEADAALNQRRASRPRLRSEPQPGLHLAVELSDANAFTWATADMAVALAKRGVAVSLPWSRLHSSIEPEKRELLRGMMREDPRGSYHVKWSHFWPKYFKQALSGDVNAEFFCTNYRYRPEGRALDLWMRNVQLNGYKKLAVSGFNREALLDVGVPESEIAVVPLGYSPEIDAHFPASTRLSARDRRDLHILLVTNSHDLMRYGTDLAIKALAAAFGPEDAVVVHIKDYGRPHGRDQLQEWIAAQPRFPRVVWHRKFLSKLDLLKLYADCDVQLAPFRGEGFAMKICDAMALGVPSLLPLFGGPAEFAAPGTFIPLPFDEVPVGSCADSDHHFIGQGAYWCEARTAAMTDELRSLLTRREELARIGSAAREHVRARYSWDEAARKLMNALDCWGSARNADISVRNTPDLFPVSVVIPTKDRVEILEKTLHAYARQTLHAKDFELLIVNDHGAPEPLEKMVEQFRAKLPIRLMENPGPGGSGPPRNFAFQHARGEIIVITGDDIVPVPEFLAEHIEAHRRHPALESAVVGMTHWHPDLEITPFMQHITGEGGEQFLFRGLREGGLVPFDRFYTSNCSLKREFIGELHEQFCTHFRMYGYEDVELAYRLHLRGMELRFSEKAAGYHFHPTTLTSFLDRQHRAGRMLTVLSARLPAYVPNAHTTFLQALEFMGARPAVRATVDWPAINAAAKSQVELMRQSCEALFAVAANLAPEETRPVLEAARKEWKPWFDRGATEVWKSLSELSFRLGMAEEWAQTDEDRVMAQGWTYLVSLPRFSGPTKLHNLMPYSTQEFGPFQLFGSYRPYETIKYIRTYPLAERIISIAENSRYGRFARGILARMLRGG